MRRSIHRLYLFFFFYFNIFTEIHSNSYPDNGRQFPCVGLQSMYGIMCGFNSYTDTNCLRPGLNFSLNCTAPQNVPTEEVKENGMQKTETNKKTKR